MKLRPIHGFLARRSWTVFSKSKISGLALEFLERLLQVSRFGRLRCTHSDYNTESS